MPFLVSALLLWAGFTSWACFIVSRHADYYITKADNKVLRAKISYIAGEIEDGRKYLTMSRQTEQQLREVLGMGSKTAIIEGKPSEYEDSLGFKSILETKASEISESLFKKNIDEMKSESKSMLASFQEITWYIANQKNVYRATPSIPPCKGRLASHFGYRLSPFGRARSEYHSGIDLSGEAETPIYATADGVVRHAGWGYGYGQTVLIDHGFGYSTLYGHTTQLLVKEGDRVQRGQMIAKMGTTGRSTGIHLHYEVWFDGTPVNPLKYIKNAAESKDEEAPDNLDDFLTKSNGG